MDLLIPTGHPPPDFTLPDLGGAPHTLSDLRGRIVIVNFWSAECPWAERADGLVFEYLKEWGMAVKLLPVASNANEGLELLRRVSVQRGLPFVLHDADHRIADLYGAQTTPHLFVIDGGGILRYQGAPDDVNFRQREPTQHYLYQAVEDLVAGRRPAPAQTLPYGCALVRFAEQRG